MLIFIIISSVLFIINIILLSIISKNKSKVKEADEKISFIKSLLKKNHRKGYYNHILSETNTGTKFDNRVYVIELDRYTNGKSKIKIDYIENTKRTDGIHIYQIENYINEHFESLVETKDIEWLESVNEIQKEREDKLKRILSYEKNK